MAVLAFAAAPAGAALTWSEPQALTEPRFAGQRVAIDARGNALAVWSASYGERTPTSYEDVKSESQYRWYVPGRGWGPVHDLPRAHGFISDVAITPRGEAHAVVMGTGAELVPVRLWTGEPGEPLRKGPKVTDAAFSSATAALGLDDAGNALVAWAPKQQQGQPVFVSSRPAGGDFGEPRQVGDLPSGNLDVVTNPAGAAAVSWMDGDSRPRLAYRPAGGEFGGEEDPGLGRNSLSRLGIDLDGRVFLTGSFNDGIAWTPGSHPHDAAVVVRSPLGGWSEQQILRERATVRSFVVDPRGVATFMVNAQSAHSPQGTSSIVTRFPDGRLESEPLAPETAMNPMAAMNHRGDVLATWATHFESPDRNVYARERAVGESVFGPATALGQPEITDAAIGALNDQGQAVVLWHAGARDGQGIRPGPITAVVRDDPALHDEPAPPEVTLYKDPLAALDGDGDLRAPVRCDQSCKVTAAGIVFPGKGEPAAAARGKSVRLRARRKTRVKIDFGAEGARRVREALAAGRRPWVSVTVSGRGKSPRPLVVSRRYRLAR